MSTVERPRERVELALDGMTCASCAARIERTLNRLDGVEATVNFATEQVTVRCDPETPVEQLVGAVESVGYVAHPVAPAHEASLHHRDEPLRLTRRLALAVVLSVPVVLLAMIPPL